MANVINEFDQGNQSAYCLYVAYHAGDYLVVQHIQDGDFTDYRLNACHLDAIKNISSFAELVDYAKANSKPDLYQTLYNRNPDDFRESPVPDGYYVDHNNCLMPIPDDAPFCEYCESAQLDDALDGDFCKCEDTTHLHDACDFANTVYWGVKTSREGGVKAYGKYCKPISEQVRIETFIKGQL